MSSRLGSDMIERFVKKIDSETFWTSSSGESTRGTVSLSPEKKRPRTEEPNTTYVYLNEAERDRFSEAKGYASPGPGDIPEKKSPPPDEAHEIIKKKLAPLLYSDVVAPAGQKIVVQNRKVGFFVLPEYERKMSTSGYTYSNEDHDAILSPKEFVSVVDYVEKRCREVLRLTEESIGNTTNFHVNEYTAEGVLGYHSDSEIGMNPDASIISLSFGSTRIFRVAVWVVSNSVLKKCDPDKSWFVISPKSVTSHNKKHPDNKCVCVSKDYEVRHGDVIVMLPGCQKVAKHSIIPCRKKEYPVVQNDAYGGIRHNVTLRVFEME